MSSLSALKNINNDLLEQCYINKLGTFAQNNFTAGYSLRLLRGDYTGPMVNVRRSSDNATQDFYGDIQGNLGTIRFANGQSLISWLNGSTAFVTSLYDQSGYNRPVTQSTNANQPTLTTTGNIVYNGSSTYLVNTTPPLTQGIQRYTCIANFTSTGANADVFDHNASSLTVNQRVCLIAGSTNIYFSGESNDVFIIPAVNNVNYKCVLLQNSTISTNNITIYINGTAYQCTSGGTPTALNPTPYYLNIGRKSYNSEYFTGNINEIMFFNCNLTANEALTYYSPNLITRKNYRSKPKLQIKGVTRTPIAIPAGNAYGASYNQIFVDSNMLSAFTSGNTISTWGGVTAFNSPVYTGLSGYSNSITQPGFVTVSSASSQYLTCGSKTFNIASNGGFTAVCYIKFNSFASSARIFDFGNGQASNNVLVGTFSTSGDLYFHMYNGATSYQSTSATGFATTGWNLLAFRYTYSNNGVEFFKNGALISSNTITGANITNKTWSTTYIGRSHWADPYANWSMAGFYAVDTNLSDAQISAVSNHLTFSSTSTIPQTLPDYSRVKHTGSVLTYTGRTDSGVGTQNTGVNNFVDVQDVPGLPMSFSFWFNSPPNTNQTIVALCDKGRDASGNIYGIQCDINSSTNFQVFCGLPTAWTSQSFTIATGTWYHVVICVGLSNNVVVYFNGTPTTITGTAILGKSSRFLIGSSGDAGRGSTTTISDFRVFDYILRNEEVTALYTLNGSINSTISSKENYLVNYYNWYNIMIQQKTNGSTYSTYTMSISNGDPDVNLQMGVSSQTSSNCIYNINPIQNYESFTCSFEINSNAGSGNCFYFFVGGTAIPAYNATLDCDVISGGYIIQFEEFQGNTSKGINLIDNTPVVKVNYPYTIWINSSIWYPVTITYTRGTIGTWVINFNGVDVITYSDPNNVSWLAQAGSYWGIGASNQGANSTKYIRRLELSYVPFTSSLGKNTSPQNLTKYPRVAMTANTSSLSDGTYIASASNTGGTTQPYYAFTNDLNAYWGELSSYSNSGVYTGGLTTTVSSVSYSGEWIQLQLPNAITLYSYTLTGRQDQQLYAYRLPTSFIIAGSNDGSTWVLVDKVVYTNFNSQYDGSCNNYICAAGNTNSYTYFRLILQKIGNTINSTSLHNTPDISEWCLFAQNNGSSVTSKQIKIPTLAMNANNAITFQPVTPFNWYTLGTKSGTTTQAGSDPFTQLRITDGAGGQGQIVYSSQPVQNYPFTFTFQLFCNNTSNGDHVQLAFGSGGSAVSFYFQIYAYQGIRFYDSSGTLQVSSATNWYNSTWNEIRVVYNATAVGTWTMFFNGTQIIQYSDPNFWNLIMNGGSTWGFYTFNGAARFDSYIRQLNMDFNMNDELPGTIQCSNQNLSGNYIITASQTRTDRATFPYYVADNTSFQSTSWAAINYGLYSGAYTGAVSTTVSGVTQSGEWIQYQLPNSLIVSSFTLLPYNLTYAPRSFCLAGSVDGSTWVSLYDNGSPSTSSWVLGVEQNFKVNNNGNKYSYYRLIIRATGVDTNTYGQDWLFIDRFDLFTPNGTALSNAVGSTVVPPTFGSSNTLSISGNSNNLLNGTYTASASSYFVANNNAAYLAFQGYQSTSLNCWGTAATGYSNTTGIYTANTYNTTVNNISYSGEWIQLQVPNALNITSFILGPQIGTYTRAPVKFVLAGSKDGSTWYALHIQGSINSGTTFPSNVTWSNNTPQKFNCNQGNNQQFTYFRFIVTAVTSSTDGFVTISQLSLITTPPKPSGLLDGLTWKFYDGANSSFSTSFYSNREYISIGRTVDTSNYRTILNGLYQANSQNTGTYTGSWSYPTNCSIELFGYFRPTISGTWTFWIWTDDTSYIWIGNNALSGYTTGNANATTNASVSAATSFTISLIAGVYYPIRMQQQQGIGGVQMQLSFQPPSGGITSNGQGYFFSGNGTDSAFPHESAKIIKDLTNTNTDGIYYILVNGVSTPTYCLMNDIYDGGGWMMLMKMSTNTQAFTYDSSYWKYINTLNASDLTRNTGDAKYNVFNYTPVKDILGIWPDISPTSYTNIYGNNGGSFFTQDGWTWLLNNWSSGSKVTGLSGFSTSRPAGIYATNVLQPVNINNPFYYNGYGTCFSNETGSYIHYINSNGVSITGGSLITGTNSPGTASCNVQMRWGMIYNNETGDLNSSNAYQGIGINNVGYSVYSSAADLYGCCGTAGINRAARFELFGR